MSHGANFRRGGKDYARRGHPIRTRYTIPRTLVTTLYAAGFTSSEINGLVIMLLQRYITETALAQANTASDERNTPCP